MHLATLAISFALEEEVAPADRERVLRSLVSRLRQHVGSRAVVKADHDATVFVSFFDERFEQLKHRANDITATIDDWSELRMDTVETQLFRYFEGSFTLCETLSDPQQTPDVSSVSQTASGRSSRLPVSQHGMRIPPRK